MPVQVTASRSIKSPAELIEDTRGIQTLVINEALAERALVLRLTQLLKPFTTAAAVERELTMRRYTYEQTANLLGTSVKWLQRRVAKRHIPHATDGHRVWFEMHDIRVIQQALREGKLDSLQGDGLRTDGNDLRRQM